MMYDPNRNPFAGMTAAQLQSMLSRAQQDLIDLQSGRKVQSASYTQGPGARAVTYTSSTIPQLMSLIMNLKQALGLGDRQRRPIRLQFR